MINLVPKEVKKVTLLEYWLRVFSVWGILLTLVQVAVIALLVPSYVLVHLQLNAAELSLYDSENNIANVREAERLIKDTNTLINQLNADKEKITYTEVLRALNGATLPGIEISVYQMKQTDGVIDSLSIRGNADTRESLATFSARLEGSPFFETAFIPISDLAKERDLQFDITVTMADLLKE